MSETEVAEVVVGLPEAFTIDSSKAAALEIDSILEGVSLEHGAFLPSQALGAAAAKAFENGDVLGSSALYLLTAVTDMSISDDPRRQFECTKSGPLGDGRTFRTIVPADLSQSHIAPRS